MPERTCSVDGCCAHHRARGFCSTHYNVNRYTRDQRHAPRVASCFVCGEQTTKHAGGSRRPVCSYYCRWFLQNPVLSCPVPITHPAHWAYSPNLPMLFTGKRIQVAPHQRAARVFVAGSCLCCGRGYVAEDYTGSARWCSVGCARRVAKQRRRAIKKAAYVADVSPRRIYERDGWRCQLCRKPVRRDQVVPAPLAPVIDHVLPLAQGGTHEPANVQCAHFLCNSVKRDTVPATTQLMLFG